MTNMDDGGYGGITWDTTVPGGQTMGFIRPAGRGGGVDASRPERGREVTQANLVSDGFVRAAHTDGHLINPWGVSFAPGGPFWISDNGSGVATIHDGTGRTLPLGGHAAITIAAARGSHDPATPTGQVFNSTGSGFGITAGGKSAASVFLFATEDGTISGWNPRVDAGRSVLAVDGSGHGAVYKGLAMAQVNGRPRLYAADFRNSRVDIFDSRFAHVGSFTDPSLPKGYAPFNVQALGGRVFVTFALQDADRKDDVAGAGHGYVDEFDTSGHMVRRIASGGPLNSPWGLDIAPAGFGSVGGDLLVGNFGDGTIDAFDLGTDHFIGRLLGTDGRPLVIGDLWALTNGNGGNGGDPGKVYFTAGVQDEAHGLFGSLSPLGRPPPMPGHGMSPYA